MRNHHGVDVDPQRLMASDEVVDAGLDDDNHDLDTSPEFHGTIVTTRTYEDRLQTLAAVRAAE